MFWSEAELSELQASTVREKIGKDEADTMFQDKLLPLIRKHQNAFFPHGSKILNDGELVNLAHRMGSTIMAYAFDLERVDDEDQEDDGWVEDLEGQMLGMVPMADMLNADAEFNVSVSTLHHLE
jgi:N-lysine methyltransferase SETD6